MSRHVCRGHETHFYGYFSPFSFSAVMEITPFAWLAWQVCLLSEPSHQRHLSYLS